MDEHPIVNVLVNVHYSGPAVHSCANKDGQKGRECPIKVGYSVVEIFLVGISPQVGIIEWIAGSIFIELLESRPTKSSSWATIIQATIA